jgi:hypothetical protein
VNVHEVAQAALQRKFPTLGFVLGKPYMNASGEIVFPYGTPGAMAGDWTQRETDAPALLISVDADGQAVADWLPFNNSEVWMRRISPARNAPAVR